MDIQLPTELLIERRIIPGADILVDVGQEVEPETILARRDVETGPLRWVDCARKLGCSSEELGSHFLVAPGERVEEGQGLAVRTVFGTPSVAVSPCRGRVMLRSSYLGYVYLREAAPDVEGRLTVDLAAALNVPKSMARECIRVKRGDRVIRGQVLGVVPLATPLPLPFNRIHQHVLSPVTGPVTTISNDCSLITIDPEPNVERTAALIPGEVAEVVRDRRVTVRAHGWRVDGLFGAGRPVSGTLRVETGPDRPVPGGAAAGDVILLTGRPDSARLEEMERAGVAAVIAPAMDQLEFVNYLGHEIRLGITAGSGDSRMTVVLLGGFVSGDQALSGDVALLAGLAGHRVYVDGRTQIRAGARRPFIAVFPRAGSLAGKPGRRLRVEDPVRATADGAASGPVDAAVEGSGVAREEVAAQAGVVFANAPRRAGTVLPPADWVYPCCRPDSPAAYRARFPHLPEPRPEEAPGSRTLTMFPGLPVLDGPLAERLEALAAGATKAAQPVLGTAIECLRAGAGEDTLVAGLPLLFGSLLPSLLQEWEVSRDARGRCPGFILTPRSPASVLRAVPYPGGGSVAVLLGRAWGWTPWHLELMARSDVDLNLRTIDGRGRIRNMSQGFRILRGLGLVRTSLADPVSRVTAPCLSPEGSAPLASALRKAAGRLAAALGEVFAGLAPDLESLGREQATQAEPADLLEALRACLVDSLVREAAKMGLVPEPVPPPSIAEALNLSEARRKIWLDTADTPSGSPMERSNSWPIVTTKPISAAPQGR